MRPRPNLSSPLLPPQPPSARQASHSSNEIVKRPTANGRAKLTRCSGSSPLARSTSPIGVPMMKEPFGTTTISGQSVAFLKTVFRPQGLLALRCQRINSGGHDLDRRVEPAALAEAGGRGSLGGVWRDEAANRTARSAANSLDLTGMKDPSKRPTPLGRAPTGSRSIEMPQDSACGCHAAIGLEMLTSEVIAAMTESCDHPMHADFGQGPHPCTRSSQPISDSSRRWWVLAIVVAAQFMFGVDAFIVNVAIPTIASRIACERGADRGGDRDLSHCLCHAGGHRRPARRYPRHQTCLPGRRARLHADVAVVRAGAVRSRTDRRAAGAGRDRGADGAAGARHASFVVFGCSARPRLRHLRHRARARRRRRLSARRRAGDVGSRGSRLARGVFRQCAVRIDHHGRGLAHHADGAAPRRHAARRCRCDRAVRGIAVPDRAAAVRSRSALVAVGLAGDGVGRRHRRGVPAARARGGATAAACR